jgi:hypothetical protein
LDSYLSDRNQPARYRGANYINKFQLDCGTLCSKRYQSPWRMLPRRFGSVGEIVKLLRRRDGLAGRDQQSIGPQQGDMTSSASAIQIGLSRTGVFDTDQRYAERGATSWELASAGPKQGIWRALRAKQNVRPAEMALPRAGSASFALTLCSSAAARKLAQCRFGARGAVCTISTCLARWG